MYLDGVKKATVNLAASAAAYKVKVWTTGTIGAGRHKVTIVRSTSSATGKFLTLDAVDVMGSLCPAPPTVTGLDPAAGGTVGGTTVTITGTRFSDVTGGDVRRRAGHQLRGGIRQ